MPSPRSLSVSPRPPCRYKKNPRGPSPSSILDVSITPWLQWQNILGDHCLYLSLTQVPAHGCNGQSSSALKLWQAKPSSARLHSSTTCRPGPCPSTSCGSRSRSPNNDPPVSDLAAVNKNQPTAEEASSRHVCAVRPPTTSRSTPIVLRDTDFVFLSVMIASFFIYAQQRAVCSLLVAGD